MGLATHMYLDANRDFFWRDRQVLSGGTLWWFGFEPGDPPSDPDARDRPLDKSHGALARYLKSTDDGLQCPSFPYHEGGYWPKFAERSASYGYNIELGPRATRLPTRRRGDFDRRSSQIFVFADGVLYDFNPETRFNEGFFIQFVPGAATAWGYGHFRHARQAQVLYLDGHAAGQRRRGPAYAGGIPSGGDAANLSDAAGGDSIYGR
jgi:prepilin-type processing-associated H-X9-DG protein